MNPLNVVYLDNAAKLSIARGMKRQAVNYVSKASECKIASSARMLFVMLLKMDKPEEALPYVRYAAANNTSRFNLNELLSSLQQQVKANKRRL